MEKKKRKKKKKIEVKNATWQRKDVKFRGGGERKLTYSVSYFFLPRLCSGRKFWFSAASMSAY